MGAIFISYRRDDSEGHAGRLFEDLVQRFGKDSVFIDVSGIEPGRDFRKVIDAKVGTCGVLLAVIGNHWLDADDGSGVRRIDDPSDFVRLETASALKRDIPVVPVLVHGARMPTVDQLPPDLADLAYRNAVEITHARWESDVQVLMEALARLVGEPAKKMAGRDEATPPVAPATSAEVAAPAAPAASRRKAVAGGIAAVLIATAAAAAYHYAGRPPVRDAEIADLVAQTNAGDAAARKAATARLMREFGASPVAIRLAVDQLSNGRFQLLSREGRVNVLTYLNESATSAWREVDRAEARADIARIRARIEAGTAMLGPQVTQLLDTLATKLAA